MSLIEPNGFARFRVMRDGLANVTESQSIVVLPRKLHAEPPAVILNHILVVRLKSGLPGQTNSLAEVPDVHHVLVDKSLFNVRSETLEDFSIIGDWCFAAARSRLHAAKPNLERPHVVLGIFAMKWNVVVRGILRRSIDCIGQPG